MFFFIFKEIIIHPFQRTRVAIKTKTKILKCPKYFIIRLLIEKEIRHNAYSAGCYIMSTVFPKPEIIF